MIIVNIDASNIEKLTLWHGSREPFTEFDLSRRDVCMYDGLIYLGNRETALNWANPYLSKCELMLDKNKYKYRVCTGYNRDTYETLWALTDGKHDFDIVTVPLALNGPFADFVFEVIMSSGCSDYLDSVLECHRTKKYDKVFCEAFNVEEDLVEDNFYETIIFNEELVKQIKIVDRQLIKK